MVSPETIQIPLAMLVVFASAKILDELFERFHQPGIVGQILAGVVIGPSVLGWMAPNDFLTALAELGVMFLLFRVGLEVKASDLIKVGPIATWVAVLGVAVPFVLGWGLLRLWGEPQIESIFVGAAMVATSVGITAQVLAAKGLLQERASQIILAAAVIDDVLGLLILALVSSLAKGKVNVLELALTATLAIGFTLIVVKWGTKTMKRVVPHVLEKLRGGEAQFAMAMILLFALSVLAVYAGVAAIIGAFLAGMVLAESVGHRVHDLAQGVTELLVPFFLAGIGLHFSLVRALQLVDGDPGWPRPARGDSFQVRRLRTGGVPFRLGRCIASRRGDDPARRGRDGRSPDRPVAWRDRGARVRGRCIDVSGNDARGAATSQTGVPRPRKTVCGGSEFRIG